MSTIPPAMAEALGRLWTKFLPEIENRLALLESAAHALHAGTLTEEDRQAAHQAAHKLAGVLGTFGLHRGTDLARKTEVVLESGDSSAATADPVTWVAELRLLIENRK